MRFRWITPSPSLDLRPDLQKLARGLWMILLFLEIILVSILIVACWEAHDWPGSEEVRTFCHFLEPALGPISASLLLGLLLVAVIAPIADMRITKLIAIQFWFLLLASLLMPA
jgi:hypothetical protein